MDDETYNDLLNWEDWRLNSSVAYYEHEINEARKRLEHFESGLRNIRKELDRRALESYWQAHPEQTRVNVGDRLLVTQEYNDWYSKPHGWHSGFDVGEVLNATSVYVESGVIHVRSDEQLTMGVDDPAIIQNMRAAYLQAHPESETDR